MSVSLFFSPLSLSSASHSFYLSLPSEKVRRLNQQPERKKGENLQIAREVDVGTTSSTRYWLIPLVNFHKSSANFFRREWTLFPVGIPRGPDLGLVLLAKSSALHFMTRNGHPLIGHSREWVLSASTWITRQYSHVNMSSMFCHRFHFIACHSICDIGTYYTRRTISY